MTKLIFQAIEIDEICRVKKKEITNANGETNIQHFRFIKQRRGPYRLKFNKSMFGYKRRSHTTITREL